MRRSKCIIIEQTRLHHSVFKKIHLLSVFRPEFNNDWPLTELQTANLNRKQRTLIDAMDGIHFLSVDLFSQSIINSRHKETIHSQSTEHEKSEVLLDLMVD